MLTTKKTFLTAAVAALLTLAAAPEASAQGFFGLSFDKHKRGKHVSVNVGFDSNGGFHLGGSYHKHRRGRRHVAVGAHVGHRPGHVHGACCGKRWVPGAIRTVTERVWVPGATRRVWVPPVYRRVCTPCGGHRRVIVRRGYYRCVQEPGFWRNVCREVRDPGYWAYACGH